MGKLGYVAPEQAAIEKTLGPPGRPLRGGHHPLRAAHEAEAVPEARPTSSRSCRRARRRSSRPRRSTRACRRRSTRSSRSALAYDPEKRYPDARSFAEALVDVLFPTPHSAIQDLLGEQMQQVFAERDAAAALGARARPAHHEGAHQRGGAAAAYERISAAATPAPGALAVPTPRGARAALGPAPLGGAHAARAPRAPPRPRTVLKSGVRLSTAFLVGLLVAVRRRGRAPLRADLAPPR